MKMKGILAAALLPRLALSALAAARVVVPSLPRAVVYESKADGVRQMVKKRDGEIAELWAQVDRLDERQLDYAIRETRHRLAKELRELRAEQIPGVYVSKGFSSISFAQSSQLAVEEKHKEEQALVKWQYAIQSEIEAKVSSMRFNGLRLRKSENSKLAIEVCREFDFSRMDRHLVEADGDWLSFRSLRYGNLRFDSVVSPHIPQNPVNDSWLQWRTDWVKKVWEPLGNQCEDMFLAFDEYVGICKDKILGRRPGDVTNQTEMLVRKLSGRGLIWLLRQYCLEWGEEDGTPWRMLSLARKMLAGDQKRRYEIEWIDSALASSYRRECQLRIGLGTGLAKPL